jgi:Protein of unknown function (DUF3307)
VGMEQILLHLFGDYLLQSGKMAVEKSRSWFWATFHVVLYTIPFLLITRNPVALGIIGGTHLLIDRFSLAKYIMQFKGTLPNDVFTYPDGTTVRYFSGNLFLVYVVTDNSLHLIINYFALKL